jgi:hypothetical protein
MAASMRPAWIMRAAAAWTLADEEQAVDTTPAGPSSPNQSRTKAARE